MWNETEERLKERIITNGVVFNLGTIDHHMVHGRIFGKSKDQITVWQDKKTNYHHLCPINCFFFLDDWSTVVLRQEKASIAK